jgi:hypothetical protein
MKKREEMPVSEKEHGSRRKVAMQRFLGMILLGLCGSLLFVSAEVRAETRRALIIGIDKYVPPQSPAAESTSAGGQDRPSSSNAPAVRGRWSDLDGAVNDADDMRDALITRYDFKPENILVLRNNEATRERILAGIRDHLVKPTQPGDAVVFFYAGHGSQELNPQSEEQDKKDETIVPADSSQGAEDIRDKELRRLFNDILDKGAVLTAIFDSCQSGSIARGVVVEGKARFLPPDTRSSRSRGTLDPSDSRPRPEDRGALILSAAQDFELAKEGRDPETGAPRGAFSVALLQVLRKSDLQESAENVFLRTRASLTTVQEPVLAGTPDRLRKPLFGVGPDTASRGAMIAVQSVRNDNLVELQGGGVAGLEKGSELKEATPAAGTQPVRLRIEEVKGWSRATAQVISGDPQKLRPGDLFTLDLWVVPDEPLLRVWLPASLSLADLQRMAKELDTLRTTDRVQWIADPTEETPTHELFWTGTVWTVAGPTQQGGGRQETALGKTFSAQQVLEALSVGTANKAKLFVRVPPPPELLTAIELRTGRQQSVIAVVASPQEANYLLIGRMQRKILEYAWVFPNMLRKEAEAKLPLPVRSDWIAVVDAKGIASAAAQLKGNALRICRVQFWLTLPRKTPQDNGDFPYTLALKNTKTGKIVTQDQVIEGELYRLVLRANKDALKQGVMPRYVYVLAIDRNGKITLLFPRESQGSVENRFPAKGSDGEMQKPSEILIGDEFAIGEPFGLDTYILLTDAQPIPDPQRLEQEGVVSRGADPEGSVAQLVFNGLDAMTRGVHLTTPAKTPTRWSSTVLSLRSVPK